MDTPTSNLTLQIVITVSIVTKLVDEKMLSCIFLMICVSLCKIHNTLNGTKRYLGEFHKREHMCNHYFGHCFIPCPDLYHQFIFS